MSRVDKILEVLDGHESQHSPESDQWGDVAPRVPDGCWRCGGPPGDGASGVCANCRAILLDESTEPPAVMIMKPRGHGVSAVMESIVREYTEALRADLERPVFVTVHTSVARDDLYERLVRGHTDDDLVEAHGFAVTSLRSLRGSDADLLIIDDPPHGGHPNHDDPPLPSGGAG